VRGLIKPMLVAAIAAGTLALTPTPAHARDPEPPVNPTLAWFWCNYYRPHGSSDTVGTDGYDEFEVYNCLATHPGDIHVYYVTVWANGAHNWVPDTWWNEH
jgi:hypothetical protein